MLVGFWRRALMLIISVDLQAGVPAEQCSEADYRKQFPCRTPGYVERKDSHFCLKVAHHLEWDSWEYAKRACEHEDAALIEAGDAEYIMEGFHDLKEIWIATHHTHSHNKVKESSLVLTSAQLETVSKDQEGGTKAEATDSAREADDKGGPVVGNGCFSVDEYWRKKAKPCDSKLAYGCRQLSERVPSGLRLDVTRHEHSMSTHIGVIKTAHCSVFIPEEVKVQFNLGNQTVYDSKMDTRNPWFTFDLTLDYVLESKTCKMRTTVAMAVNTTDPLPQGQLKCCIYDGHGDETCSHQEHVFVYDAHTPILNVSYHHEPRVVIAGHVLVLRCYALVGTDGILTWVIDEGVLGSYKIAIGLQGVLSETMILGAKITYSTDFSREKGPSINSTLKIHVTTDLNDATISCYSREVQEEKVFHLFQESDHLWSSSKRFYVRYQPRTPSLEVKYHDKPGILVSNQDVVATCSAVVGTDGILTWVIRRRLHNSTKLAIGLAGPLYKDTPEQYQINHTHGFTNNMGPTITSTLTMRVSSDLEKATVSCVARDVRRDGVQRPGQRHDSLWISSKRFRIHYDRQPPQLETTYGGPPPIVYKGGIFLACCTAYVGTDGWLSWVLFSDRDMHVWTVSTKGELVGPVMEGVAISHPPATFIYNNGPKIKSRLQINVTESLEQSVVTCLSYNILQSPKEDEVLNINDLSVASMALRVQADPFDARHVGGSWAMTALSIVGALLVLVALITALAILKPALSTLATRAEDSNLSSGRSSETSGELKGINYELPEQTTETKVASLKQSAEADDASRSQDSFPLDRKSIVSERVDRASVMSHSHNRASVMSWS